MFKPWKNDKNKIKAVFRMQFQATQVPKLKKSTLAVSLVPDHVGKATVKLEKAVVQDGACSWENPVYEKVKMIRESKTGKIKEKIYHFVVSAGSSKAGFLGEASIDLADFVEEAEPLTISLPLKFANSGAILHVTIQNMQNDPREVEENGNSVSYDNKCLENQLSNSSIDESNPQYYLEDEHLDDTMPLDLSSSPIPFNNGNVPQKKSSFGAMLTVQDAHRRSNTEWSLGSASDGSLTDAVNSLDQYHPRERPQDASDDLVEKLKHEIDSFTRKAAVSELELQSLKKQLVKEVKRGQNLSEQLSSLREERDELEEECEELHSSTKHIEEAETASKLRVKYEEIQGEVDELRYELDHQKDLNASLRLQLHKTQDSNSEMILEVGDLAAMVNEKDEEISKLSLKIQNYNDLEEVRERKSKHNGNEVDSLKQKLEGLSKGIELQKNEKEELDIHLEQLTQDYKILKQENEDMSTRLEEMNQQDHMSEQVECPRCSEHVKELEFYIEKLEDELNRQTQEVSESLASINDLETQLKDLHLEIDTHAQGFEKELEAITQDKIEQEQRAIRAEELLRKTRWKNAVTAERLQEEFKRLSGEMTAKLDENEKLSLQAVAEANELRQQRRTLEEMLHKAKEELRIVKDQNALEVRDLSNQLAFGAQQIEMMSVDLNEKAKQVKHSQEHNEQMTEALSVEMQKLKSEIEILRKEKCNLKEREAKMRDESEQANTEMLRQKWNAEREDLQKKCTSATKEADEAVKELTSMKLTEDDKEKIVGKLKSQVESLMAQQSNLQNNLLKEKLEKENLRKKVNTLQGELKRREEEIAKKASPLCEKKDIAHLKEKVGLLKEQIGLKDGKTAGSYLSAAKEENLRDIIADLGRSMEYLRKSQRSSADIFGEAMKCAENGKGTACPKRQAETCSNKQDHSNLSKDGNCNSAEFLTELALFKERNKLMEKELKEMEEKYSEISLRFAEVESERQQLVMTVRNLKNGKRN